MKLKKLSKYLYRTLPIRGWRGCRANYLALSSNENTRSCTWDSCVYMKSHHLNPSQNLQDSIVNVAGLTSSGLELVCLHHTADLKKCVRPLIHGLLLGKELLFAEKIQSPTKRKLCSLVRNCFTRLLYSTILLPVYRQQ